jgi:hypothetical protein
VHHNTVYLSVAQAVKPAEPRGYIENNSVKAGLVANAEEYLWSSAARKAEMTLGSAGSTACATKLSEQYCG